MSRSLHNSVGFSSVVILTVLVLGCASQHGAESTGLAPRPMPADFSIDLTVLSGDPDEGAQPAHLRTARYTVYAGGDLHYAAGPDLSPNVAAPYVRTLELPTLRALWEALASPVMDESQGAAPIGNIESVSEQEGQLTHVLVIFADGERREIGRTRTIGAAGDPMLDQLTRTLASLAWASDRPDEEILRIPRRYDFGPDPYAPYRERRRESEMTGQSSEERP